MFDYIVIGAGSAGCVLANRLSADPRCKVLLLEAGGAATPQMAMPAAYMALQDTAADWGYRTVPQVHLQGRRIFSPRGRVLGGSSSINCMMYVRGNRRDYDHWRDLGNPGWGYDDVLPYFIRSEGNRSISDRYHGTEGQLTVSGYATPHPLSHRYLEAAQEAGLPLNPDFNGEQQAGCGFYQATIRDGARCSAADAFLQPALGRPNLTVATHALATRILFEGARAIGVRYLQHGQQCDALASAEVVLCGGAFNSPHLLMLSGVGPATELEKAGVRVLHDLAGVGKNLQDHLAVSIGCEISEPLTFAALPPEALKEAVGQYRKSRSGPLASNLLETGGFAALGHDNAWPELQLFFYAAPPRPYPESGPPLFNGMGFASYVNRPRSTGRVTLASSDPLDRPVVDPNYLSEPQDLTCAVAGVRRNLAILEGYAFQGLRRGNVHTIAPDDDDAAVAAYVRERASTSWHVSCTCKMGADAMAVVDARLRVRGLERLRVADASVMPAVVSGNTNAAVIMIGEKAADLLLQ